MTSIAAPTVLADRLVARRSVVTDVALVGAGVALTAVLAQVAHDPLDSVVLQVPVAAVQLKGPVGHLEARVGGEALGHGA